MDVQIIASIIGGLIGGLFTFLGVLITILYQRAKDKKEEQRLKEEKLKEEFISRPRLEIVKYKGLSLYESEKNVDVGMLIALIRDFKNNGRAMFYYDEEIIKPEKWAFVEYELKNTGNTEIKDVCFSTAILKNTSMFNTTIYENIMCYEYKFLNYRVHLNKNIKPGHKIKIRVYFISDKVVYSNIGGPLISLWLFDVYNNVWHQYLDAPNEKINDAERSSISKYYDYTDEKKAVECFIDPLKW